MVEGKDFLTLLEKLMFFCVVLSSVVMAFLFQRSCSLDGAAGAYGSLDISILSLSRGLICKRWRV